MNALDIKTVIFSSIITDIICVFAAFYLWQNNKGRFKGLLLWFLDFIFQTIGLLLILLRGSIPGIFSFALSNTLIAVGALCGYMGLQYFSNRKTPQYFIYFLISIFAVAQYYFSEISPSLEVRNFNVSLVLFIICSQCAWFIFFTIDKTRRKLLQIVGIVFVFFSLINLSRIILVVVQNPSGNDFFKSGIADALFLILNQILLLLLAYALTLAVNRRLVNELKVQEEKFSKTFHFSPSSIMLTRLSDGKIEDVNIGFEKMFGYSRDEIIGKGTLDINLWEREADRNDIVDKLSALGQIRNAEFRFHRKNGEILNGLFSAETIIIENQPWILSSITDISERINEEQKQRKLLEKVERDRKALFSILEDKKRTQDSLLESESRYRNLFEATNVAKSITYPDGSINVNQAFCKWLGYSSEEMKNMNWREITPAEEHERIDAILKSLGRGGKTSTRFEKKYLHKDGIVLWGDISTAVQVDNKGETKYYITTVVDITEKKAAEEAVFRLNAELEKRVSDRTAQLEATNKELEAFSYSVSHDLRAPLRHITGYVDLLNERIGKDLPEQQRHYMHVISDSAKRMGILIDDLLQFSRMGRKEIHLVELNINSLIDEIITELGNDIAGREVVWTIQKLPYINADYAMIRQVWRNLIENAVKFTRKKSKAEIEIGSYAKDGHVIFHISDNGAGFDMKYAQKLFGVFQRMHNQSEFEGTGIGLANVQRIISKHDGRVWAESEIEKGSTFYFSLPVTN